MFALNNKIYIIIILFFIFACSSSKNQIDLKNFQNSNGNNFETKAFFKNCSIKKALEYNKLAKDDPKMALKSAKCFATVFYLKSKTNKIIKDKINLADIQIARKMAEIAVKNYYNNGLAHYLNAYLAGCEAENNTIKGLELVPVIEKQAILAAKLNPKLENGGPDRMLGELYLKAPDLPISVGDSTKAVLHYKKAVDIAPIFIENRIGLISALLADDETVSACEGIKEVVEKCMPCQCDKNISNMLIDNLKQLCNNIE